MNRIFYIVAIMVLSCATIWAQNEKSLVKKGNSEYKDKKYDKAEVEYRKALDKNPQSDVSIYNLGNALYKQGKYKEAAEQYIKLADSKLPKKDMAKAYHNLGTSMMQLQKFPESVEAYKRALKLNPNDQETKYNLAYAQRMIQNPPQQQNQQNQDNKDNKDNKDKNKDQKQNQDNQDDKNKDKKDQDQQQQQQSDKLSKQDAKRMLEAIQNDEKNLQEKLKKVPAAKKRSSETDW